MKCLSIVLAIVLLIGGTVLAAETVPGKAGPVKADPVKPGKVPGTIKDAGIELLQVLRPYREVDWQFDKQTGQIMVTVYFLNADVDRSTVIAGSTVRFDFPKVANARGRITWVNDREFIWKSDGAALYGGNLNQTLCAYTPDCKFTLTLTDNIRTKKGTRLDGNKDGREGGNFVMHFIIIG